MIKPQYHPVYIRIVDTINNLTQFCFMIHFPYTSWVLFRIYIIECGFVQGFILVWGFVQLGFVHLPNSSESFGLYGPFKGAKCIRKGYMHNGYTIHE